MDSAPTAADDTLPRDLPVRLGSELFINREDSPAQIRGCVAQMADHGMALVRLFNFWDLCEPRRGQWDWSRFDAAFDAAESHGLGVVPTPFAQCPPGWMRMTTGNQEVGDFADAAFVAAGEDYLRRLVTRYAGHPALDSWIVWNEPCMRVPVNDDTRAAFRVFVRDLYGGDLDRLNRVYYEQFDAFADFDVQLDSGDPTQPIVSVTARRDWLRFTQAYLRGHLLRFTGIIRAHDPDHPVHINPHRVAEAPFGDAQSVFESGRGVDFMGASAHPVWHATRFDADRKTQAVGLFAAIARAASADPAGRFWVSELQAGPATFSGGDYGCPTPQQLRHWVWESVGRGAEAVVFWTMNGRDGGGEGGEWTLLDQLGGPSVRLTEVSRIGAQLRRLAPRLAAVRPPVPRVLILYSEASLLHGYTFGRGAQAKTDPRTPERNADAFCGAFALCDDLNIDAGFIDERGLREQDPGAGPDARPPLLILPDAVSLEAGTAEAVARHVAAGGSVIADGLTGYTDADAALARGTWPVLADVFGVHMLDLQPREPLPEVAAGGGRSFPGWFNRVVLGFGDDAAAPAVDTLASWADDGAAAVTRRVHAGATAVRIGTHFFQRYFAFREAGALNWFASLLTDAERGPVRLGGDSDGVRMRVLPPREPGGGSLVVLINTAPVQRGVTLHAGGPLHVMLPPHGVETLWLPGNGAAERI